MTTASLVPFDALSVFRRKVARRLFGSVRLLPSGPVRGSVLLSYVTHPFTISKEELQQVPHTNPVECLELAEAFLCRGYAVDVIDAWNKTFIPARSYAFCVDIQNNLERLAPLLPPTCQTLFYVTGAHWLFQNHAEYERLVALRARRGYVLRPRRTVEPSRAPEIAQRMLGLGNAFIRQTYGPLGGTIHPLPLPASVSFSTPVQRADPSVRKRFLWIGGGGAVHKGLDLVLEAFASLPEYELTVCGPVAAETDFVAAYQKELFETPNIRAVGRINVRGPEFKALLERSVAVISPSCSEGTSGSVVTGMHGGLIPIVSRASGVEVGDFGVVLPEATVEAIVRAVRDVSALPEAELRRRSLATWEYAQAYHTRARFREEVRAFIASLDVASQD